MIGLRCSTCGLTLSLADELAGQTTSCPRCRHTMPVPAATEAAMAAHPRDAATIPPIGGEPPVPADPPELAATLPPDAIPPGTPPECYDFLAPAQGPGELGRLGPYRILGVLGTGGMGVVFRAEDPQLQREVALKALLPALAASASARQRFLREARAAAAFDDDHIVRIYQVGEDRGIPFLAMQFLRGESLDALLARQSRLPLLEVIRIGREIAQGLAAAHAHGLIHRDIKPANIWLETLPSHAGRPQGGRVKILDFGLARAASGDLRLTQPGAILGTPGYMAPEQTSGRADHRCDLFSLGCVLYRMATGQLPFRATDPVSTLMAVATEHPPAPRELDPALPPALDQLIMQLLAKDPAQRPASAAAVVETLQALESQTGSARLFDLASRMARGVRGAVASFKEARQARATAPPTPHPERPKTAPAVAPEAETPWALPAPPEVPPVPLPRSRRPRWVRVGVAVLVGLLIFNVVFRPGGRKPQVAVQTDDPARRFAHELRDRVLAELHADQVPSAARKVAEAYLKNKYRQWSITAQEMADPAHALFHGTCTAGEEEQHFRLYVKRNPSKDRWQFDRIEHGDADD